MKNLHYGHCLLGIGIAAVALIAFGVSAGTLGYLALVAACPLMMFVMTRTMMSDNTHGTPAKQPFDQDHHQ